MRPDPLLQFWLGIGVVGLFLVVVAVLAFAPDAFDRRVAAVAAFNDVSGLVEGSEVHDGGFLVGRVSGIDQNIAAHIFQVRLSLSRDWTAPPDTALMIQEVNPLRPSILAAVPTAGCGAPTLPTGFRTEASARVFGGCGRRPGLVEQAYNAIAVAYTVLGHMSEIVTTLQPLVAGASAAQGAGPGPMARANEVLGNLVAITGSLDAMLSAPRQRSIADLLDNLAGASRQANDAMVSVNRVTLARVNAVLANATTASGGLDRLLRDSAPPLQQTLQDTRYLAATTSASLGPLLANLQAISANLGELTRELRDNPAVIVRGRGLTDPVGGATRP